jgi:hypothetical protein
LPVKTVQTWKINLILLSLASLSLRSKWLYHLFHIIALRLNEITWINMLCLDLHSMLRLWCISNVIKCCLPPLNIFQIFWSLSTFDNLTNVHLTIEVSLSFNTKNPQWVKETLHLLENLRCFYNSVLGTQSRDEENDLGEKVIAQIFYISQHEF